MASTVSVKTPYVEVTITDKGPGEGIFINGHAPSEDELCEAINKAMSFRRYPLQEDDPLGDLDTHPF